MNSHGSLYDSGTFYVTKNTTMSLTMNWLITSCFNELNSRYAEVASSIATGNDYLIQYIGNWVNQQIDVIQQSNGHLNNIDDLMWLLKNLRGSITQIVKRHAKVDIDNKEQATGSSEGIYNLDANNLYGGVLHASNDAVRIGGCTRAMRSDGEDQSWPEWMGSITQDVR